jgi:hypothetical protein
MHFPSEFHQIWSFTGETVLMIILDTVEESEHHWHPWRAIRFVKRVQKEAGIRKRNILKLNRALPCHQGIGKDYRPKVCFHCKATPESPRIALREFLEWGKRRPMWFYAHSDDPNEVFICALCFQTRLTKGRLPDADQVTRWDEEYSPRFQFGRKYCSDRLSLCRETYGLRIHGI